jgi:ADP-ribose diphosphatase
MPNTKPVILATTMLATTGIFEIEGVHLRFRNGEERHFERLRGRAHESVMIVPMLDATTVLLVREYGVGLEDYYLGLPKGTVDLGEDFLDAANRELMEETGYGAGKLELLKSLSSAPAYTMRKMKLVLAQDLYPKRLLGDEPEPIDVIPWQLTDLDQLMSREDFHEARSIAALYMVRDMLHGDK